MKENLTLEELERIIEKVNQEEIKKYTQIEKEKLQDFAENLKFVLINELNTIETGIKNYQEKTIERTEIINKKLQAAQIRAEKLNKQITYNKTKHLLVATLVGVSLVIGAFLGSIVLGKWVSMQMDNLQEIKAEIAKAEKIKEMLSGHTPIEKVYRNGLEFKKGYTLKCGLDDDNLWFAEVHKED